MEGLSLEKTMDYLKPKIVDSFQKKDYDKLIEYCHQFRAAKYIVDAVKMHSKDRK